jgi:hypothetical protein
LTGLKENPERNRRIALATSVATEQPSRRQRGDHDEQGGQEHSDFKSPVPNIEALDLTFQEQYFALKFPERAVFICLQISIEMTHCVS